MMSCCSMPCPSKDIAPLLMRLSLAAVFIPVGIMKVFTNGYMESVTMVSGMATDVVPTWLATFMGYLLPGAELYIGFALLLGFGKWFTKGLTLFVTLSLVVFWYLKDGSAFTWFSNAHTWYFLVALVLSMTCFGSWSVDAKLCKKSCAEGKCCS